MTEKTKISLTDLQHNIQTFRNEVSDFSAEKYEGLKKKLTDIQDDVGLVLLESQERYQARLARRPELNKQIKEYNKEGPKKAIESYIQEHTKEFLERLEKKGVHVDDKGNMLLGKLKRGNQVANLIPVQFTPKELITGDHYDQVKARLEVTEKSIIGELTRMLEDANENSKNIFESYTTPSQLFEKLGIVVQKVNYSFFAQEHKKEKGTRRGGTHDIHINKEPSDAPKFKKIGYLMKYLTDNKIPFRANNIIEDNNQRYQFYFYDNDISLLISDVIMGNGFRDATYVIKGLPSGLRNINREELKNHQGKKIVFNESWPRRIEGVFTDNPSNWPIIGEEKEIQETISKTLIQDRSIFIGIIKENFTPETLTAASYKRFAQEYNDTQGNTLLLNDTICGNASLLGLGGKKGIEEVRSVVFEHTKPKLEIPKSSYIHNEYTRQKLLAIAKCEGFDPDKTLGNSNYGAWVLELLRKAYNEEYVDAVKNKSQKEKKAKLKEFTGIEDIPLFALKMTTMLGGRVRCTDTEYQKMLRQKFVFSFRDGRYVAGVSGGLEKEILEFETAWEDGALHPNVNKAEKKNKPQERVVSTGDTVASIPSKRLKKLQENVQSEVKDIVSEPITLQNFPLFELKKATVIGGTEKYRRLMIQNSPIELRLYKSNLDSNKTIKMVDKIEIFGVKKNERDGYIKVFQERKEGYHKMRKFFEETQYDVEDLIHGEAYNLVINNTTRGFIWVSLNEQYSGRITPIPGKEYKIGEVMRVVFDGVDTKIPDKIKVH